MIDMTPLTIAIIDVCIFMITAYLIPWIKSKTSLRQQEIISEVSTIAVFAAQQLFKPEELEAKKNYAMERVEAELKRHKIKLSTEEISTYIEGVLKSIKTSITDGEAW